MTSKIINTSDFLKVYQKTLLTYPWDMRTRWRFILAIYNVVKS